MLVNDSHRGFSDLGPNATFLKSGTYALSRIVAGQSTIGLAVRAAEPSFCTGFDERSTNATFLKSGTYALSRIVAGQSTIGLAVRAAEPVFLHRICRTEH